MSDPAQPRLILRLLRIVGNLVVCVAILAAAVAAIIYINKSEPTAEKIAATRKSAALVETIKAERGTYSPRLIVLGTVQPAQDIMLSPRVSGQVVELSPELAPGGMVREGDLLLRIDPADFENAVSIRQSELQQSTASLEIEEGRQSLAKKELALLEGTIDETNRALVLRQPQIASIRAEVNAKESALERAQLDLERTRIVAPFDAQVLTQSFNIGSQVSPGDELARLVGVDEYWIIASVPVRSLRWIQFPESGKSDGSKVRLRNPETWPAGSERVGHVSRMIGALDQQTRLARVLITVNDPLGKESGAPPLILDTLVETEIEGTPIEDVVRLDRKLIRDSDTVWVMKDEKLEIRETDIVFRDADHAYVRSGVDDGDEIVVTTLATVAEGVGLRKVNGNAEVIEDDEQALDVQADAEGPSDEEPSDEEGTGELDGAATTDPEDGEEADQEKSNP